MKNIKYLVFVLVLCLFFVGNTKVHHPDEVSVLKTVINSDNSETASWTSAGLSGEYINDLAIDPTSSNTVLAAVKGEELHLAKTTDGGASWNFLVNSPTNLIAVEIDPGRSSTIFVGAAGAIYRSGNGGESWSKLWSTGGTYVYDIWVNPSNRSRMLMATTHSLNRPYGLYINSTWGLGRWERRLDTRCLTLAADPNNPSTVYVGTEEDGYIFRSTNQGWDWYLFSPGGSWIKEVRDIEVDSNSHVYAATNEGLMKWDGSGWTNLSLIHLRSVYFTDSNTGWAVGNYGRILKTTDGGTNWTPQTSGISNSLGSVFFTDSNTGWAVGGLVTILKTTDGGNTWTPQTSGTSSCLHSVYFTDSNTGWAVGWDHVGWNGTILKTTDGGNTWTPQTSGTNSELVSVYFTDSNTGWAVGADPVAGSGTILKTTDGGTNWTPQTSGTSNSLASVYFTDSNTGWAVGGPGTILKTTDGGTNWTPQTSGINNWLDSVYFTDSNTGWAVGSSGTILKTTDGGNTWTPQTSGTEEDLQSVHFTDSNTGWVVGWYGTILKTTDGGNTWTPQTSGIIPKTVNALTIDRTTSPGVIFAGTDGNGVFVSKDGGDTWTEFNNGLGNLNITKLYLSATQAKILYAGTADGVWSRAIQQYTLTIASSTGGTTNPEPGTYNYSSGAQVSITATSDSGYEFLAWTGDVPSGHENDNPLTLTMDSNKSITANFSLITPPFISLSPSTLNFGATTTGYKTSDQNFRISNTGGGILDWSISDNADWLSCSPTSGTGNAEITASVDPSGLAAGTYPATITVSSTTATNSPQTIDVTLTVISSGASTQPFGSFDTPGDGTTGITGAIPVTGWVLDDVEATKVEIWRDPVGGEPTAAYGLVYIGDSIFVEGARPDIEQMYPDYPLNYRAGWGYMILTNFLPNQGNGTYVIHALAYDKEENNVTLGTKTITCDNATAVKPFGTIDTPGQGGEASGSAYVNFGWALTPQPNYIPEDGSTIWVYIDSVPVGHPVYNNYREDIATFFPGLANSDGAVGYYYIDTTTYDDGVHTIAWSAADSGGNTEGIGSRYFMILNTAGMSAAQAGALSQRVNLDTPLSVEFVNNLPVSFEPIRIRRGYARDEDPDRLEAEPSRIEAEADRVGGDQELVDVDNYGAINIEIREVERVEIGLGERAQYRGYLVVGDQLRSLPIGSTLDTKAGIFSWQPGPGFIGAYDFVFIKTDKNGGKKIRVKVRILPKHLMQSDHL